MKTREQRQASSALDNSVKALGFEDYTDYLKSDHWKQFRRSYQESERPQQCLCCERPEYQLHHVSYKRLGKEELDDVIPLCRRCHERIHEAHRTHHIPLENYRQAIDAVQANRPPSLDLRFKKLTKKNSTKGERRRQNRKKRNARRVAIRVQQVLQAGKYLVQCPKCGRRCTQDGMFCCMCGTACEVVKRFKG